jgi:hypothetical protein
MRIGAIAERSGVLAETIRHYERIGLIPAPARTASGYRHYRQSGHPTGAAHEGSVPHKPVHRMNASPSAARR